MSTNLDIGIVTVATNRYVRYWKLLATSVDNCFHPTDNITMHVFTDQVNDIESFARQLQHVAIRAFPIHDLTWPMATLKKFQVITDHADHISGTVLIHLDADMLVEQNFIGALTPTTWDEGIALVRHPGYRRPSTRGLVPFYTAAPGLVIRDSYRLLREGGLGTWEKRKASAAFVGRSHRRTYVCGGTWMGRRAEFLQLCNDLSLTVSQDESNNIVARFHDESHLNWFAAHRSCSILDSDFCHVPGFRHLDHLEPKITAVDKHDDRTR